MRAVTGQPQTPGERERRPDGTADDAAAMRDASRFNRLFAVLGQPSPLERMLDVAVVTLSEMFAADVVMLAGPPAQTGPSEPTAPDQPAGAPEPTAPDQPAGAPALSPVASIGIPEGAEVRFGPASRAAGAAHRRIPVVTEHDPGDPSLEPVLRDLDLRVAAWLPVFAGRGGPSILLVGRCRPLPFARSDVDLLTAMAHRLGVALERDRAEEERRLLDARLRQAEKHESLARMAGAVAHHVNNKLSAVLGSLEMAEADIAVGRNPRDVMALARAAALDAARIGDRMLAYLGLGYREVELLDLCATVRAAIPGLVRHLPAGFELVAACDDVSLPVVAAPDEIRDALASLVENAVEASPAPAPIRVATGRALAREVRPSPEIDPSFEARAASYAWFEVADAGEGMSASMLRVAFDPFFSTRFQGRGLGLPSVFGMARAHEGTVTVRTVPGKGTAVRVWLPLDESADDSV